MLEERELIHGSGGVVSGGKGSSGASTPSDDPDGLRSNLRAEVLFALSEGLVEGLGLTTGQGIAESIYLNDTPIRGPQGINFQETFIEYRPGAPSQDRIPAVAKQLREFNVGVTCRYNVPVTRNFTDSEIDSVSVRILFPSLLDATSKQGELKKTRVTGRIQLSTNGGAFQTVVNISVNDKTSSPYEKTYRVPLPANINNTWSLRVIRDTLDSNDVKLQNDIIWQSYTTREKAGSAYLNTALLALSIPSKVFPGSVPKVSVDIRGINCPIPHNYNGVTHTYSGTFNGTMVSGWTNNPVWVLYDLLTDTRYGAGVPASTIDVFSFYSAAQYCDETIPSGVTNLSEYRYTCNGYFTQRLSTYQMLSDICSIFRGNIYYSKAKVKLVLDRPTTPLRLYSKSNVVVEVDAEGTESPPFNYTATSLTTRTNACVVRYLNPNTWQIDEEYYEDSADIAANGYKVETLDAIACTSRGQAYRMARWHVYTSLYQTEVLTFSVADEGLLVEPGDIIKIADESRAGVRTAGRIVASTTTSITVDSPVTLAPGGYVLSIVAPNGNQTEVALTNAPGTTSVLTWATPAFFTPIVGTLWVLTTPTLQPQLFQAIRISNNENGTYDIEALSYNASKFSFVENNAPLVNADITNLSLNIRPEPIYNLQITEFMYRTTGSVGVRSRAQLLWGHPDTSRVSRFQVEYQRTPYAGAPEGTVWTVAGVTETTGYDIDDLTPGVYNFRVKALGQLSVESNYFVTPNVTLKGLSAPPATVVIREAQLSADGDTIRFSWDNSPDLDVFIGGHMEIRHTPKLSLVGIGDGFAFPDVPGNSTSISLPTLKGTYTFRWVDSTGNKSTDLTKVANNQIDISDINLIYSRDEIATGLKGYSIGLENTGTSLSLAPLSYWDGITGNWDDTPGNWDDLVGLPGYESEGQYYFNEPIDLGGIFTSKISSILQVACYNNNVLWDDVTGDWDSLPGLFDGDITTNANALLQISTSLDMVEWSPYLNIQTGNYTARGLKFRLVLNSYDEGVTNILVTALSVTIDVPEVIYSGTVTTSVVAPVRVNFPLPYHPSCIPVMQGTVLNAGNNDVIKFTGVDSTGFFIDVFEGNVFAAARNVAWTAIGFGKKITTTLPPANTNKYYSSESGIEGYTSEDGVYCLVPESNV